VNSGYGRLDKLLHRLALHFRPLAELSFDLDQRSLKIDVDAVSRQKHVFVSGLARAGTTILMRRLYATHAFQSLTYQHMPFVLAPNMWMRMSSQGTKPLEAKERAHGDGILVNAQSPESLDEVFWRIFDGEAYIHADRLSLHDPSDELIGSFRRYVAAILQSAGTEERPELRYLSKNNNNILRLPSIAKAFPESLILIPFRHPLSHAHSLLRQHRNFLENKGFERSYMAWLAHHEFGADHRPFRFSAEDRPLNEDPMEPDYWLSRWSDAYEWLERTAPANALFVCYEDLCQQPDVWTTLADHAGVAPDTGDRETFRLSKPDIPFTSNRLVEASRLYERLRAEKSIAVLT